MGFSLGRDVAIGTIAILTGRINCHGMAILFTVREQS